MGGTNAPAMGESMVLPEIHLILASYYQSTTTTFFHTHTHTQKWEGIQHFLKCNAMQDNQNPLSDSLLHWANIAYMIYNST